MRNKKIKVEEKIILRKVKKERKRKKICETSNE